MTTREQEKQTIEKLYKYICEKENIIPVMLYFGRVGKGGALCAYGIARNGRKRARYLKIDIDTIQIGAAYALCHEVAHQMEINENENATHNYKFKKREKDLVKKYANCEIARKLIF